MRVTQPRPERVDQATVLTPFGVEVWYPGDTPELLLSQGNLPPGVRQHLIEQDAGSGKSILPIWISCDSGLIPRRKCRRAIGTGISEQLKSAVRGRCRRRFWWRGRRAKEKRFRKISMKKRVVIDKAGRRCVIPMLLRENLHLEPGDSLEMDGTGDQITLRPVRGTAPLTKEHGVRVFRAGQPLSASSTDEVLQTIREGRERSNSGRHGN
jgi:AbrB family looped-hinge helix DNA binding protein